MRGQNTMRCKQCGNEKKLFGWHTCVLIANEQQRREIYNKIVSANLEGQARPKTERQMRYPGEPGNG